MTNKFDSANYPDSLPGELVSGDRWAWTRSDLSEVYGITDYDLLYRFTLQSEPFTDHEITAGTGTGEFVFEAEKATTGDFAPGAYRWACIVRRKSDSAEVTEDFGTVEIGDLVEGRSHAYKVLQLIRATIEKTASREESSYSIQGRSLAARSPSELLDLEKEYARRWADEKRKIDRKAGRKNSNRVLSRLPG